jgi:hypothetical protein
MHNFLYNVDLDLAAALPQSNRRSRSLQMMFTLTICEVDKLATRQRQKMQALL